jgi:hypothetical protein
VRPRPVQLLTAPATDDLTTSATLTG